MDTNILMTIIDIRLFFQIDCVAFAHLSQCLLVDVNYPHKKVLDECPNLLPYLERLKQRLWPDWDDIVNNNKFD